MDEDIGKRTYLAAVAVATIWLAMASLHGVADVWLWGHNGFNGAAFFNGARNSLRFGLVGQALYHFDTRPPHPASLYTHHPLLVHFHLIAMQWLFGAKEWAGRAVPAFYSVADIVVLAWVTRRHWSRRVSAMAVIVYALTPLNLVFANMIDHEQGSITFLLLALDGVATWFTKETRRSVVQACVGFAIAAQWDWPAYPIAFLVFCVAIWRARHRLRDELPFLVPLASTMLVSFGGFFAWIWVTHGSFADMRSALAMRTGAVDGLAARLWDRSLDLYGPILVGLLAVWLVWTVRRKRAPRDIIVFSFLVGQVFHTLVFRQAGFIHAYWTWHANPGLAIAVAELVAWLFFAWGRPAYAIAVCLTALQALFAMRQFQWGYATGGASYAYAASDTDQRDENLWAREVARVFPREGTRYWLSASIHRRRTEFDVQLDAPMLAGEAYLSPPRPRSNHEVALIDLHHLVADAEMQNRLQAAIDAHATRVWDDRFLAIDFAAPAQPLLRFIREEEPTSWWWSWLHQPGARRFRWTQAEPRPLFHMDATSDELHGGAGGKAFAWTCPGDGRLLGVDAAFAGDRLTALRPRCDTGDGPWVGGRFAERPSGLLGRLVGHERGALPTRAVVCADGKPLADLRVSADRTVRDVTAVCEGERDAVGLRGHYGDLVDGVAVLRAARGHATLPP